MAPATGEEVAAVEALCSVAAESVGLAGAEAVAVSPMLAVALPVVLPLALASVLPVPQALGVPLAVSCCLLVSEATNIGTAEPEAQTLTVPVPALVPLAAAVA